MAASAHARWLWRPSAAAALLPVLLLLLGVGLCTALSDSDAANATSMAAPEGGLGARASWSLLTASAQWSPRAGGVVELYPGTLRVSPSRVVQGPMFLMYGIGVDDRDGPVDERNQVWYSTGAPGTRGRSWTELIPDRPFSPYLSAMTVQDHRGRQFRIFGADDTVTPVPDIYMSTNGGMDWTPQHEGVGPYPPARYHGAAVVDSADTIYIIEGRISHAVSLTDVWKSVSQGRTWSLTCATVPWRQRGVNMAVATVVQRTDSDGTTHNVDIIYAMAGYSTFDTQTQTPIYHNDVWISSNGGRNWIQLVARAPWLGRGDAQVEITSKGVIIVVGGYANRADGDTNQVLNDVWASLDGGYSWGLCSGDAEFSDRRYQYTVIDTDSALLVMGGRERDPGTGQTRAVNDVWRSNLRFDEPETVAAMCSVLLPRCGKIGLQCLPTSDGFSTGLWGVSCSQCPWLTQVDTQTGGSSSSAPAGVTIALVVFVIAFVLSLLVMAYYYFRLSGAGVKLSALGAASGTTLSSTAFHKMDDMALLRDHPAVTGQL